MKTKKMFFVHFPGCAYAGNFYGVDAREARAEARKWLGVSRLPRGTSVWEA